MEQTIRLRNEAGLWRAYDDRNRRIASDRDFEQAKMKARSWLKDSGHTLLTFIREDGETTQKD